MSRPEVQAPPEIFYNDEEARKYTSSSRIIQIQAKLSERALELLALPDDGVPRLLLDIGCGSGLSGETLSENGHQWIGLDISQSMLSVALEREAEGDLILGDMGQVFDLELLMVLSVYQPFSGSATADKSSHEPRLRLKCLARGARAVFQVYPESVAQRELILSFAMRAGFAGGVVVDFPHSLILKPNTVIHRSHHPSTGDNPRSQLHPEGVRNSPCLVDISTEDHPRVRNSPGLVDILIVDILSRKEYLVLTCGPPSLTTATPKAIGEDEESCSEDETSEDEENETVCISDRHRPRKKQKITKKGKGREWVLRKKEQMRKRGNVVPPNTKYTARKRKARF
ncbi:hypothetical protein HYC85_021560 [Camellia sinensis]|uniref:18S rRNA (guanine(1575)-N(7))-methyltransferase Bud23 C-terminal domain-containing protein n=1 Tax=Camellia sinensis TaxID=4442 RepID=A0A7J7GI06_CAMSI|nr:hypothetical protein HYC85_021560 [Camellia sinensis]